MNRESPDLLIAGASARAAAFSAVRAGLRVAAADLFADRDLAAVADVTAIEDWPAGIESWAARFSGRVPFVYVGGLENEPELLRRVADQRYVLGTAGACLRLVRDAATLMAFADSVGLLTPEIAAPEDADPSRRWLVKSSRSSAGRGVRIWNGDPLKPTEYLQRFVDGRPGSASFLAASGSAELLGCTEMLLPGDRPPTREGNFAYAGSITAESRQVERLQRLADVLAGAGLLGLFGIDFIRCDHASGVEYIPIEVNPRYTAGMEVLELKSRRSLIAEHLAVVSNSPRPVCGRQDRRCIGKRIVYAPAAVRAGELPLPPVNEIASGLWDLSIADVPAPGTLIPAGGPICTVLAAANSREDCLELLKRREADVLSRCERG